MSLGSWFRDYVYIPLGGNRVKKSRWLCNLIIVWFLTGFWHGAEWNFIIWGLFFGVLLILEKLAFLKILKKFVILPYIYVIPAVLLSFVLFDSDTLPEAWLYIRSMFGAGGLPIISTEGLYYLKSFFILLVMAVIGATPLVTTGINRLRKRELFAKMLNIMEPIVLLLLMFVITGYIVDGSFHPFLYFRF